jgi:peroxiredoxin
MSRRIAFTFVAALALLGLPTSAQEHHGPGRHGRGEPRQERLGQELQDFTLTDSAGTAFRLSELRRTAERSGKIVVLTFWCTTCHSCREVERGFDAKAREYAERGVTYLMVDSNVTDTAPRVREFLERNELSFRVLMDAGSAMARYFGATRTTTTAVIDADGRLRYYGGLPGAEAAVRNLLAGEQVAVPESPGGG